MKMAFSEMSDEKIEQILKWNDFLHWPPRFIQWLKAEIKKRRKKKPE